MINIFLLCYNESVLLTQTISHYRHFLPSAIITIYDNESTDNSVEIAKSLGCNVISWSSNNAIDDFKYKEIKNNCWKHLEDGWIIVADMDEWLCISESDLTNEREAGITIITTKGLEMIGESNREDINDINLHNINKYIDNPSISKKICFYRNCVEDINYEVGAHTCSPTGNIVYSSNVYNIKHMNFLGLPFILNKTLKRYERSEDMRKIGLANHYINDTETIINRYNNFLTKCKTI
jgi:hypothetical protein